jgi:hypothetical protein
MFAMRYKVLARRNGWESYIVEADSEKEAEALVRNDPDEYLENDDDQDWSIVSIKEITNEV